LPAESNDEGISVLEQEAEDGISCNAKDLVSMVQHWREKYNRERYLRAQAIEEFRRLIMDMQHCPSGCSKREIYNAALLRRSKSPTPDNDDDLMGPISQSEVTSLISSPSLPISLLQTYPLVVKVDISSQFPELPVTPSVVERGETPVIKMPELHIPLPIGVSNKNKRKSSSRCSSGQAIDHSEPKLKPLTGFEILYQAITFSENMDGNRSDSGCSEETFDSNEPPKKQRKYQSSAISTANMERVCS
jgi:hypothetical protein